MGFKQIVESFISAAYPSEYLFIMAFWTARVSTAASEDLRILRAADNPANFLQFWKPLAGSRHSETGRIMSAACRKSRSGKPVLQRTIAPISTAPKRFSRRLNIKVSSIGSLGLTRAGAVSHRNGVRGDWRGCK